MMFYNEILCLNIPTGFTYKITPFPTFLSVNFLDNDNTSFSFFNLKYLKFCILTNLNLCFLTCLYIDFYRLAVIISIILINIIYPPKFLTNTIYYSSSILFSILSIFLRPLVSSHATFKEPFWGDNRYLLQQPCLHQRFVLLKYIQLVALSNLSIYPLLPAIKMPLKILCNQHIDGFLQLFL